MNCPICGRVMTWDNNFNMWTCSCGYEYTEYEDYTQVAGEEWDD